MHEIIENFSTREIALGIWSGVFVAVLLIRRATRKPTFAVISLACRPKLLVPMIIAGMFTWLVVTSLSRVGFWTPAELKDTIIWFIFAGATLVFRGVSSHQPDRAIRGIIWDAVKVTVVVEFVVNFYTFPLWVEILLLPVATLVACLLIVANSKREFSLAASFLGKIQTSISLIFGGFTLWLFVRDAGALWSIDTIRALLLPIVLSVAMVPLAYSMALISAYEQLFFPLTIGKKPFRVRLYAKLKLWGALGVSLRKVCIARRRLGFKINKINTFDDVDEMAATLDTRMPAQPSLTAHKASFHAGYEAGYGSGPLEWEAKLELNRLCDVQIVENRYDPKSFDEGFGAGTEDADLQASTNS